MRRFLRGAGRYFVCYIAGIVACVAVTPVELLLLDAPIGLFFIPLAPIGYVLFYLDLTPQYVFGSTPLYWAVYGLGLGAFLLGIALLRPFKGRFRFWSPLLVGFPVGFVGTLGVYYAAASSI